jgi:hypothetical protein
MSQPTLHALLATVFLAALAADSHAGMQEITKGKVVVSCKLPKSAASIQVTIDLVAKRAVATSNNGVGGSSGPMKVDLTDTGHQSARVLINPSNGWMAITMTTVDAKNSDLEELELHLQRPSDTAPYRILDVSHGAKNLVSRVAYGYLQLDVFNGKTCDVTMSGQ